MNYGIVLLNKVDMWFEGYHYANTTDPPVFHVTEHQVLQ
jgi:hypothetical protein